MCAKDDRRQMASKQFTLQPYYQLQRFNGTNVEHAHHLIAITVDRVPKAFSHIKLITTVTALATWLAKELATTYVWQD